MCVRAPSLLLLPPPPPWPFSDDFNFWFVAVRLAAVPWPMLTSRFVPGVGLCEEESSVLEVWRCSEQARPHASVCLSVPTCCSRSCGALTLIAFPTVTSTHATALLSIKSLLSPWRLFFQYGLRSIHLVCASTGRSTFRGLSVHA